MMNYFETIPNELLAVIVQLLPLEDLLEFRVANKKIGHTIKSCRLNLHVTNFVLFLCGFTFTSCNIRIRKCDQYYFESKNSMYNNAIRNLAKCDNVRLARTKITSRIVRSLQFVHTVEFYICNFGSLSDKDYELLRNIKSISLNECPTIDYKHLPSLEVKFLSSEFFELDKKLFRYLAGVPDLSFMYNRRICGEDLSQLTSARSINLAGCNSITNCGLGYLSQVEILDLTNIVMLNGDGFAHLTNVQVLNLQETEITDQDLEHLGNVRELSLQGNYEITGDGLKYLSSVTKLNLQKCNGLEGNNLVYVSHCKQINLANTNINDDDLQHLQLVEDIDLSDCNSITDEGIKYLSNVRKLNLSECNGISGEGFLYTTGLRELNLSNSGYICENNFIYLRSVEKLIMVGCNKVTYRGLRCLTSIRELMINNCKKIKLHDLHLLSPTIKIHYSSATTDIVKW